MRKGPVPSATKRNRCAYLYSQTWIGIKAPWETGGLSFGTIALMILSEGGISLRVYRGRVQASICILTNAKIHGDSSYWCRAIKPVFEDYHTILVCSGLRGFLECGTFSAKIRKVPDKLGQVGNLNCTR